jgi:hypothetical protein
MSTLQKKSTPSNPEVIDHDQLEITSRDAKLYQIRLKDLDNKSLKENLKNLLDEHLTYERFQGEKIYFLKKKEINEFLGAIADVLRDFNNGKDSSSSEDSDDEDSTDDEMIQKALARRFKYKSSLTEIDEGHISESQTEESVSLSRRLRSIYRRLAEIERRLAKLEK